MLLEPKHKGVMYSCTSGQVLIEVVCLGVRAAVACVLRQCEGGVMLKAMTALCRNTMQGKDCA